MKIANEETKTRQKFTRVRWPQNEGTNKERRKRKDEKKAILKNKIFEHLNVLENEILGNKFAVH